MTGGEGLPLASTSTHSDLQGFSRPLNLTEISSDRSLKINTATHFSKRSYFQKASRRTDISKVAWIASLKRPFYYEKRIKMDEHNQCVEAQESNASQDSNDTGSLQKEANACTAEEQRSVLSAEQQRVSAAADPYLPDLCFEVEEPKSCEKPSAPENEECTEAPLPLGEVCEEEPLYLDFGVDICMDPSQVICSDGPQVEIPENNHSHVEIPENNLPKSATECTQPTKVDEFLDLANDNFGRIDTNEDGFMSEEEIDAAVQNPEFSERDARFVAALKKHQEELEELNDDETGDENDGITRADIAQFDSLQKQMKTESKDFENAYWYAQDNFAALDKDGDGHVTTDELGATLKAGGLDYQQIQSIQTLKALSDELEETNDDEIGDENDGFTKEDLKKYWGQEYSSKDHVQLVRGVQATMDATQRSAEEASSRDLYANPGDPLQDIVPEAVHQGGIGDCYFNSALASLAANDPQAIADMINDNGDGTYTVTFPGAPDEPITVSAPTEQELALYSHGSEHGLWAPIMAKAYGQYCQESVLRRGPFNLGGGNVPQEGSDGGSATNAGLRILTGRDVNRDSTTFTSTDELHESLSSAFRDGRPVTAYIINIPFTNKTDAGLPDAHEYSVIDYDEASKTVTVRNPWGHSEPTNADGKPKDGINDGVFKMSIEDFHKEFSGIAYAE